MILEVNGHIRMAKQYLSEAFKLLENDPYDAAEKVWASVKHATAALTTKFLGRSVPAEGISWREFVKRAFLKAGLDEEEASDWAAYYIDVRDRLHGGCFYGLNYEEPEHRPLIERATHYVELVRKLVAP
jgi:hypothetical protein